MVSAAMPPPCFLWGPGLVPYAVGYAGPDRRDTQNQPNGPRSASLRHSFAIWRKCACQSGRRRSHANCIQSASKRRHSNECLLKRFNSDMANLLESYRRSIMHRVVSPVGGLRHRLTCDVQVSNLRQTQARGQLSRPRCGRFAALAGTLESRFAAILLCPMRLWPRRSGQPLCDCNWFLRVVYLYRG
jgi:hypothetical protein